MATLPPMGLSRTPHVKSPVVVKVVDPDDWTGWINYHLLPPHLKNKGGAGEVVRTFEREKQEQTLPKVVEEATYTVSYAPVLPSKPVSVSVTGAPALSPVTRPKKIEFFVPDAVSLSYPCDIKSFLTHFSGGKDVALWVRDSVDGPMLCLGSPEKWEEVPCANTRKAFYMVQDGIKDGVPVSGAFRAYLEALCMWCFKHTYRNQGFYYERCQPYIEYPSLQPGSYALEEYFACLALGDSHGEAVRKSKIDVFQLFFNSLDAWHSKRRPPLKPLLLPYDGGISSIFLNKPPTDTCAYHCDLATFSRATICSLSLGHPFRVSTDDSSLAFHHVVPGPLPEPRTYVGEDGGFGVTLGKMFPRPIHRCMREFVLCTHRCTHNAGVDLVPVRTTAYEGPWVIIYKGMIQFTFEGRCDDVGQIRCTVEGRVLTLQEMIRTKIMLAELHHPPFKDATFMISAPWANTRSVWVSISGRLSRIDLKYHRRIGAPQLFEYAGEGPIDYARLPTWGRGVDCSINGRDWHCRGSCDYRHAHCVYNADIQGRPPDFRAFDCYFGPVDE
jgi:hypothetical protein